MNEQTLKKCSLQNGLTATIFDASKKIAGDRWYVSLVLKVEIPVNNRNWNLEANDPSIEEARRILGESVVFEKKLERNFISPEEKQKISSEMMNALSDLCASYLRHHDFAKNFISIQFKKAKKRQSWYV